MTKVSVGSVLILLQLHRKTMRCSELVKQMESLGFAVKSGSKGNHRTFNHPAINTFNGGNFDCGHGRNPAVLPIYISKIIKIVELYQPEIEEHLRVKS